MLIFDRPMNRLRVAAFALLWPLPAMASANDIISDEDAKKEIREAVKVVAARYHVALGDFTVNLDSEGAQREFSVQSKSLDGPMVGKINMVKNATHRVNDITIITVEPAK